MKKKQDKIDRLLDAYSKSSAIRIARKKEISDRLEKEEKERDLLEQKTKEKITGVFRPVMQKLLVRLDKTQFECTADKLGSSDVLMEQHTANSKTEEGTGFWMAISLEPHDEKPHFSYSYFIDDIQKVQGKHVNLEDITEELIEQKFIWCLEKLCT